MLNWYLTGNAHSFGAGVLVMAFGQTLLSGHYLKAAALVVVTAILLYVSRREQREYHRHVVEFTVQSVAPEKLNAQPR